MGYIKETLSLLRYFEFEQKTIIEFGSQDISVSIHELDNYIRSRGKKPVKLENHLSDNYSRLSSRYLFDSLGVKEYKSIDIDEVHGSLKFDLNFNIKDKYDFAEQYDFVTNFGTTEHIFNQLSCFENVHNLCKVDGIIIIGLPISGYKNHCFYNYQPTFFKHLADRNGYEILYVKYFNTSYYTQNDSQAINVVFKKKSNNQFIMPIQNCINESFNERDTFRERIIKNQFLKITKYDLNNLSNIAIFGTSKAAQKAYEFSRVFNINIVCFIDDFKNGIYKDTNIKIVDFDTFIEKYQKKIDLILQGNKQKGDIKSRDRLKIDVVELSPLLLEADLEFGNIFK